MNPELPFKPVYRVGYECPMCDQHHTYESHQSEDGFLAFTQCPTFPALGWIRLEGTA